MPCVQGGCTTEVGVSRTTEVSISTTMEVGASYAMEVGISTTTVVSVGTTTVVSERLIENEVCQGKWIERMWNFCHKSFISTYRKNEV